MLMLYIYKYVCEFLLNNVWIIFWFFVVILFSLVVGRKKIWIYRYVFIYFFLIGKVDIFIMEIWVWIKFILFFVFLISIKRLFVYGVKIF